MMHEMTQLQNLHYALGELAYAIACADGELQKEERNAFEAIVTEELKKNNFHFHVSEIIFQIMEKDRTPLVDCYQWAMRQIRLNSHYLSPELKATFKSVIGKIAAAFPPVTIEERALIAMFEKDIDPLVGDPIYYDRR
jgi:hypothetical protein